MRKQKINYNEKHLQKMLDYLEDAPRRDRIDIVRDVLAPKLAIIDDEFALEVFEEVIAPVLAEDIIKYIKTLKTN